jgi:hypothetical protein
MPKSMTRKLMESIKDEIDKARPDIWCTYKVQDKTVRVRHSPRLGAALAFVGNGIKLLCWDLEPKSHQPPIKTFPLADPDFVKKIIKALAKFMPPPAPQP